MTYLSKEEFKNKYEQKFADNEIQNITEPVLREFKEDIADSFASVSAVSTSPVPPAVSFNTATRQLLAEHPLGVSELEYSRNNGAFAPYEPVQVDDAGHPQGEWRFRVRATGGRNASAPTDSPLLSPKTQPVALTVGLSVGSASLTAGNALNYSVLASGGTKPYQHRITARNVDTGTVSQLATPTTAAYSDFWPNVPAGTYELQDTVNDAAGNQQASLIRRVEVTVQVAAPAGPAPEVKGFLPDSGPEGTIVTITGSFFTDATAVSFHGTPANFHLVNASTIVAVVPIGAKTGQVAVSTDTVTGTSAASFTVGAAASTPTPVGDTVAPNVSFTTPASGAVLTPQTQIVLTVTANDNVAVAGLTFTNGATGEVLGSGAKNGNTYTLPFTTGAAGSLSLVATATDAAGNSQSATVNVRVEAATAPTPTATTPDAPFPSYDPVTRVLTFSHALGTSELEYNRFGGTFTGYAPIQVDDSSHNGGEWKARVKAYAAGNRNASGTADSPAITAKTTVNRIPVADAGADLAISLPTSSVALMGTASDPDGDPLTYAWRYVTGPNVPTGLPATTLNVVISNLVMGTYQLGFRTTDALGNQSPEDYVLLSVNPAGSAPGAPTVTFDSVNRILKATHALGTAEIEYQRNNGPWQAYAQIYVDDNGHTSGEWHFRTRAATNRPAGNLADSPSIARVNNGSVVIPADRSAKLALSDGTYAAAELALKRIIDASTFYFSNGAQGVAPGTGNRFYLNRMWVRDALFTLKALLPYFPVGMLTSWMDRLLAAAALDNNRVPDRITAGGGIERVPFAGMKESPYDNNLLAIETAWLIFKKTGSAAYYQANKAKLEALYNALPKQNGLVYIPAHVLGATLTSQFFGFYDSEVQTGYGTYGTALQYRAALRLAEMAQAAGDNTTAQGWVDTAALVKAFFNSDACGLWDAGFSMYRSASLFGREVHDIPGNALAVEVGLADDDKSLAISYKLNATISEWAFRGGVRHIMMSDEAMPGVSCWRYFVDINSKVFQVYNDAGQVVADPTSAGTSSPYRQYQNGAYWYTFTREIYTVLALTNEQAAKQLLYDAVVCSVIDKDAGQDNVECFNLNGGERCNQYCGSAAGIFSLLAGGGSDPANVSADLAREFEENQNYLNSDQELVQLWLASGWQTTGPNSDFSHGTGEYTGGNGPARLRTRLMSPQRLGWVSPKSNGLATMQMVLAVPGTTPPDSEWTDVPLEAPGPVPAALLATSSTVYPAGLYDYLVRIKPGSPGTGIRDKVQLIPELA